MDFGILPGTDSIVPSNSNTINVFPRRSDDPVVARSKFNVETVPKPVGQKIQQQAGEFPENNVTSGD